MTEKSSHWKPPAPGSGPKIGLSASVEKTVPHERMIAAYAPRLPDILSTPAMIAMMEVAAASTVQPEQPPGVITVGTRIEGDHLKAVKAGALVRVTARLTENDGPFLPF